MYDKVKIYYGETLTSSDDLQTSACCTNESDAPAWLNEILASIHPEVSSKYYGCGLVAPDALVGLRVLDLGSGSGRDCYALSALVGEQGEVVGVDMTEAQLEVARRHLDYHREQFGHARSNVRFLEGYIERLNELGLEEGSFDLIVSNCVINLSPDKPAVLDQAFRLLKPGGELYFSDVYADRRVPDALRDDPVLYGECLSGALYWNDFENMARAAGFMDPRIVEDRPLSVDQPSLKQRLGNIAFFSATYRLFKVEGLEPGQEDYGQSVIYNGSLPDQPQRFVLDKHHGFDVGRREPVSGNTWRMLAGSRFAPYFEFVDGAGVHLGAFDRELPFDTANATDCAPGGGCCC
ncbi:MAG: methyltransferase domain-containing protein [Gammaproteobacteria bacterium]